MASEVPMLLNSKSVVPSLLRTQRWHLQDSDERACAYLSGPAPNRWAPLPMVSPTIGSMFGTFSVASILLATPKEPSQCPISYWPHLRHVPSNSQPSHVRVLPYTVWGFDPPPWL